MLQALLQFCTHHNFPLTIVSDNGTEFNNQLFTEFTEVHKIIHHKTLPHCPSSNGNIERLHLTLLEHLRVLRLRNKNDPVTNLMPYAIIGYNSSVHSFTKCRPYDIINGHFDPRDPLEIDIMKHLMQQYVRTHREQMQIVYSTINEFTLKDRVANIENRNKTREQEVEFQPNQEVFISNPLANRQKLAPRYIQDKVLTNLPIHIYTSRKKDPIAKHRIKRVTKNPTLLQDTSPGHHHSVPDRSTDSHSDCTT